MPSSLSKKFQKPCPEIREGRQAFAIITEWETENL